MFKEAICHHPSESQTSEQPPYNEGVKAALRAYDRILESGLQRYHDEDRERFLHGVGMGATMVAGRISEARS